MAISILKARFDSTSESDKYFPALPVRGSNFEQQLEVVRSTDRDKNFEDKEILTFELAYGTIILKTPCTA